MLNINQFECEYHNYIKFLKVKEYSDRTVENYSYSIDKFILYLRECGIDDVGNGNIRVLLEDYQKYLKSSGKYTNTSINQYFLRLGSFLRHLNFFYRIDPIKTEKNSEIKYLTTGEIREIIKTIPIGKSHRRKKGVPEKLEAIICFMFNTGARVSEVTKVNINDIRKTSDGNYYVILHGKGNKTSKVGLTEATYSRLLRMLSFRKEYDETDPLFVNFRNERLSTRGIQKYFHELGIETDERLMRETGHDHEIAKRFTPHSLRHSLAIYLLNVKKVPINIVKEVLRHESIVTTQHYLKISNDEVISTLNNISL